MLLILQAIRRGRRQRGAAALELALILPSLLAVTGVISTLGRGFYTQYLLLNIANTAVHSCTLQQQNLRQPQAAPDLYPAVSACISQSLELVEKEYQNICGSAPVTSTVTPYTMSNTVPGIPYHVVFAQVELKCSLPITFIKVPGLASVPIRAVAAMPYIN